jgi:hypothetical protein
VSLKFGKTEIRKLAEVLDADYDTVDDAALAALKAMDDIFASRAKFVVVGQLCSSPEQSVIPGSDPKAIRISMGWYSTEGDAKAAADSLWSSLATGEQFKVWVLPVHHGTPFEFHKLRKTHYEALEAKVRQKRVDDIRAFIKAREEKAAAMAAQFREGVT